MTLDEAVRQLDAAIGDDVDLKAAWKVARSHAKRGRRISSTTLPRVAAVAQHAILARDALDLLFPTLDPQMYSHATTVREHLVAMIDAASPALEEE